MLKSTFLATVALSASFGCCIAFASEEANKTFKGNHSSDSKPVTSQLAQNHCHSAKSHYITIPVLYVTDRAINKNGYGPQRKTEQLESIEDLHFGSLDYSLKTDLPSSDIQKQLGWKDAESKPRQLMVIKPLPDIHNYHNFSEVVKEAAKQSGTEDVFIMVHGFNTPFVNAARNAAMLSLSVQHPVILFSWPSKGKAGQYDVDLGNNEWSQEHFDELLEELSHLKDSSGLKFTLVAHSMGNRIAVRSAPVLRGKHIFKEIFLVDPDFDAETFVHYLVRYARKNTELADAAGTKADAAVAVQPTRVRILFSHKDHALPLSEFLFGGYTRLGQAADTLLAAVVTPLAVPAMLGDVLSGGKTSEENASKGNSSSDNIKKTDWIMNFEWIDFTVLDHGLLGHTIPYDLIANLWSTGQPGDGLKLVHSDNGAPNRLASLFLRLFSEANHVSSKINNSERVVLTSSDRNTR